MKVSDFIIQFLLNNGSKKFFGYIGGAVTHIYDSVAANKKAKIINTISEQGAGFAAEGYARITGKTGVAIATSGPGATNLITPIGSCFFDSIPVLFITGQVNTYEYKYNKSSRQIGFQETDIVSIAKPIVKYAVMIDDVEKIRYELEKAYFLTQHGRKGPVLIDIPMNIQRLDVDFTKLKSFYGSDEYQKLQYSYDFSNINKVAELLQNANRPILLIGGGARLSDSEKIINKFLHKHQLPIVHSLMGKDVIKDTYKYNMGLIGAYGNRYGNLALANADLIIVVGSRLDTRQTGTDISTFAREAKIVQIDVDINELSAKVKTDISILSDIEEFFKELDKYKFKFNINEWLSRLLKYKIKFPSTISFDAKKKIPNSIVNIISKMCSDSDIVSVDVGQHQMWTAQSFETKGVQRVLFSGGMGSMGFALPAAIGAFMGSGRRVIVIVGDGGFQMNIQELEIIARRKLPIKIFIMNNGCLGMVRQFQELYFKKRYIGTMKDYSVPNFEKIGTAYGIKSKTIYDKQNILIEIQNSLQNNDTEIINIIMSDKYTSVEPKLIVGKPIEDMYPFIDKDELTKLMFIKLFNTGSDVQ
jgi:acetolactate synthase-1/2/3 large subunit